MTLLTTALDYLNKSQFVEVRQEDPDDLPPIFTTSCLPCCPGQHSLTCTQCFSLCLKRCPYKFAARIRFSDAGLLSLFKIPLKIAQELAVTPGHSHCPTGNCAEAFILQMALQSGIPKEYVQDALHITVDRAIHPERLEPPAEILHQLMALFLILTSSFHLEMHSVLKAVQEINISRYKILPYMKQPSM